MNKKILIGFLFFFLIVSFAKAAHVETNANFVFVNMKDGGQATYPISFINSGERSNFEILIDSQTNFVKTSEENLEVKKSEEGKFDLVFDDKDILPGVYVAKLLIKDYEDIKEIPVVLEVESEEKLFDVSVDKINTANDESGKISFYVNLYNLGTSDAEAEIEYKLVKISGEEIFSSKEKVLIDNQLKLTKSIPIPTDLPNDNYIFYAVVKKDSSVGTGFVLFSNSEKVNLSPKFENDYLPIALGIIILLICSFLAINYFWDRRLRNETENWKITLNQIKKEKHVGNVKKKIDRLKHQLEILEKAYERKYIKKESYLDGKRQITSAINSLKKRL